MASIYSIIHGHKKDIFIKFSQLLNDKQQVIYQNIVKERLKIYEKENRKKREEKISTGLPKPYISNEITAKQALAEQRYKDRYFGKLNKSQDSGETTFAGALMALGIIKIFAKKKDVLITLTDL